MKNYFVIGDKVKNMMRSTKTFEVKGVVTDYCKEYLGMLLVDYSRGKGPEKTSFTNLELIGKPTDVQMALRNDPDALALFAEHFMKNVGRIEISCQSSCIPQLASELSFTSSLTEINAVDFINSVSEKSHGAKFDILVSDKFPVGLSERLGVFFHADGLRADIGEVQINSRPLAEWLMRVHNVLPKNWLATAVSA